MSSFFAKHHISVALRRPTGPDLPILGPDAKFELPTPGIYTLEGHNEAGKSVLIKLLMSVLPLSLVSNGNLITTIKGDSHQISDSRSALNAGLVAVFQDDELIPSMSVLEQIMLRHASSPARVARNFIQEQVWKRMGVAWLRDRAKEHFPNSEKIQAWGSNSDIVARRQEVLARANEWLRAFGFDPSSILPKLPRHLSGGARAAVRLTQALLHREVAVLFLDEALNGVEAARWPRMVDALRRWQRNHGSAIVTVSHRRDELLRWEPTGRYSVHEGQIRPVGVVGHERLFAGLPVRVDACPVFSAPYDSPWVPNWGGNAVALVDQNVARAAKDPLNKVLGFAATHLDGSQPRIIEVAASDSKKNWSQARELIPQVRDALRRPGGTVVVIGGGTVLNLGGFVASTLFRGDCNYVVVPTTSMAVADVALGSKTSINFIDDQDVHHKNLIGTFANPSAIVLDKDFMESLPYNHRRFGLAECIKHGALQDEKLYERALALIKQQRPEAADTFAVAQRAMELKSRVLSLDPWEREEGRLLLYGHLHAHSLERASRFRIQHGSAVLFGILVDLHLAGNRGLYKSLAGALRTERELLTAEIRALSWADLSAAYAVDTHSSELSYAPIALDSLGQYASVGRSGLRTKKCGVSEIETSVGAVLRMLNE